VVTGLGVCAQVLVPSQSRNMQSVSVQVIGVPTQFPAAQASPQVQSFPSLQPVTVRHSQVPPALVQ
jgi:hypothetical protein